MSKPATKAARKAVRSRTRKKNKKLKHKELQRREAQSALAKRRSLGAKIMEPNEQIQEPGLNPATQGLDSVEQEALPVADGAITEPDDSELDEQEVEGQLLEHEASIEEAIPASIPHVAEPTTEQPMQAASEPATEIKEPAENNG